MADPFALYQEHKLAVLAVVLAIASLTLWFRRDRRLDKMPGPRGWPLIGIGISLPHKAHFRFREWAAQYGEVFRLRVGWFNWVVINSPQAMQEILNKQSQYTSSKMPAPLGNDVVMGGMRMFTLAYGQKWRAYRNITHQLLSSTMTNTFVPSQEYEVKQLLYDLSTSNRDQQEFQMHVRRFAFSIMMTSTYGLRVTNWDDEDVQHALASARILGSITRAGAFLVDELPFLARLPAWLQPGRRQAEAYAKPMLEAKMLLWRRLQKQVAEGNAPVCYARELMENSDSWRKQGLRDEDAAWVAGGNLEAGSTTTSVTLLSLLLHLAAEPRAQQAAHDELMRVVGPDRPPVFDDMPSLPYIRACIKEVLRMHPTPFWGIKHYTDADVVYKDYVIPKGTILLGNTSFIHYDPDRYDEPFVFRPERYLGFPKYSSEYANQGDPYQRDHFTFGMGRRICPGARLAENSLDLALANIVWAFEVRPPLVDGVEAKSMDVSDDAWEDTSFRGPKPFGVRFVPRGQSRLELVQSQWKEAEREGYVLRGQRVNVNGYVERN
ncbi:putative O-methylsterigmatocystin oxidoreductase [Durotheca rogersii]|uniref:putative O-methylsterigmatocystin oxidoreductase n=1 Tax=Durotheca rogersii TaxID=419775 RepID=UPI0022211734|nr:putative O-methylsterigmatocystin oxidoreductase [Durotheca rogersii]KAI5855058.1 putative O-methylsterigmatocystin oxidoreductase [Durotheca rogersii]